MDMGQVVASYLQEVSWSLSPLIITSYMKPNTEIRFRGGCIEQRKHSL